VAETLPVVNSLWKDNQNSHSVFEQVGLDSCRCVLGTSWTEKPSGGSCFQLPDGLVQAGQVASLNWIYGLFGVRTSCLLLGVTNVREAEKVPLVFCGTFLK
jgi:hypothetical protein